TGLRLPTTLIFDHPTPTALATYIHTHIPTTTEETSLSVLDELDRLEKALAKPATDQQQQEQITARLNELVRRWNRAHQASEESLDDDLTSATDEELFEAFDNNFA
ncbi:beta-ketoacyl synthase, partial [Kitasatospora sp. NPDC008115]